MSRRELASSPLLDEISPEVGEIDEAAVTEALEADPDELLALLAQMTQATDVRLRALAKSLAARIFVDIARTEPPDARGIGRIVRQRYRPDRGDLDIEGSADALLAARAERRLVEPDELVVRAWGKPSTAWCLVVDRSGSMHGGPLATAALAAAAIASRADDHYAVLSFSRDVVAVKAMWEQRSVDDVIDRVLALRGHGTTDVAKALLTAAQQQATVAAGRRITVLLSDCRATEPGDVVTAARCLDELVILAPDGDSDEAEQLAGHIGARWATVDAPTSIVAALASVLDR
ncbi:MAG: VWA domain-containing protein [Acidimicrobiia bacterium]